MTGQILDNTWRTSRPERETTLITAWTGDGKPLITITCATDGTVRIEQHTSDTLNVRVTRDGPAGYHSETKEVAAGYNAVTLLAGATP